MEISKKQEKLAREKLELAEDKVWELYGEKAEVIALGIEGKSAGRGRKLIKKNRKGEVGSNLKRGMPTLHAGAKLSQAIRES